MFTLYKTMRNNIVEQQLSELYNCMQMISDLFKNCEPTDNSLTNCIYIYIKRI